MIKAYQIKDPIKPKFMQRIFQKTPRINAIIDLNNLLAKSTSVLDVTFSQVENIGERYNINLNKHFPNEIKALYRLYLWQCFEDKNINEQELKELSHLKSLLGLNDSIINEIHDQIFQSVYKNTVKEVISDGKLNEEEINLLSKLRTELNLSEEITDNIYKEEAGAYLKRYLEQAISDQRLSPDEERELSAIANCLRIRSSSVFVTL